MCQSGDDGKSNRDPQGQKLVCLGPMFPFRKFGRNGTEVSTLLPHIGSVIDDICLIRSMTTEAVVSCVPGTTSRQPFSLVAASCAIELDEAPPPALVERIRSRTDEVLFVERLTAVGVALKVVSVE